MKVFRENPDSIFDDLKRRNASAEIVKEVIKLDKKWRVLIEEGNKLRAERNSISKEIGELKKQGKDAKAVLEKMSGIKDKLSQNEKETKEMLNLRDQTRMRVPNILETDVPVGENDEGNKEIGSHGLKRSITNPKPHQEIIENIGGADLKRAAKISGRRFYFLTGDLARLEMALINYAVDYLCQNQYTLTIPPFFMNR